MGLSHAIKTGKKRKFGEIETPQYDL
jgi:hypothetical protein